MFAEAEAGKAVMDTIWFACWVAASGENEFYSPCLKARLAVLGRWTVNHMLVSGKGFVHSEAYAAVEPSTALANDQ